MSTSMSDGRIGWPKPSPARASGSSSRGHGSSFPRNAPRNSIANCAAIGWRHRAMTEANKKADDFRALHVPGRPFVLFNIWDPGTAKAVAASGARAIATGSWSVAAANGFSDGEDVPLDLVIDNLAR